MNIVKVGARSRNIVKPPVADIAITHGDMRRAEYRTTLAATIGITLDGRQTIDEAGTSKVTDDHISLTGNVIFV